MGLTNGHRFESPQGHKRFYPTVNFRAPEISRGTSKLAMFIMNIRIIA